MGVLDAPFPQSLVHPRPAGTDWDKFSDEGGKLIRRGRVQSYSDFESGYDGFAGLFSAAQAQVQPSLTTEISAVSGNTCLKLSTGEKPLEANDNDNTRTASAYKRLLAYRETGLISISAFFAVRSGGDNQFQPVTRYMGIGLDMQKQDNSSRSFPRVYYVGGYDAVGFGTSNLQLQGDSGLVAVPSSASTGAGANENKGNWNYLRLTYDRDANGGLGGYFEVQINNSIYDAAALMGTNRGAQTPQNTALRPFTDYRGGVNAGLFCNRNLDVGTVNQAPAVGFFDRVCVTIGDVKA